MRCTISAIAQVIYTAIPTNRLQQTIPDEVPPKLIAAGVPASSVPSFLSAITIGTPASFSKVQGLTPSIEAIGITAYKVASAHAGQTVFYSTIAFSGVCVLCALLTPNVDRITEKVIIVLYLHNSGEEIGGK